MSNLVFLISTVLFLEPSATDSAFWIEIFRNQLTAIPDPYV